MGLWVDGLLGARAGGLSLSGWLRGRVAPSNPWYGNVNVRWCACCLMLCLVCLARCLLPLRSLLDVIADVPDAEAEGICEGVLVGVNCVPGVPGGVLGVLGVCRLVCLLCLWVRLMCWIAVFVIRMMCPMCLMLCLVCLAMPVAVTDVLRGVLRICHGVPGAPDDVRHGVPEMLGGVLGVLGVPGVVSIGWPGVPMSVPGVPDGVPGILHPVIPMIPCMLVAPCGEFVAGAGVQVGA